jgi:DNA-binding transcriptional LysR family regulator
LRDTLPENLLDHLQSGEVELLLGPDGQLDQAGLDCHPVLQDKHWLVCRSDDALCKRSTLQWRDLAGRHFVAPTRDFADRLRSELGAQSQYLLSAGWTETSYFTTALGLVSAGMGITLCPTYARSLVQSYGLAMLALRPPWFKRRVSIYSLADRELSPAARSFIECLDLVVQQSETRSRQAGGPVLFEAVAPGPSLARDRQRRSAAR